MQNGEPSRSSMSGTASTSSHGSHRLPEQVFSMPTPSRERDISPETFKAMSEVKVTQSLLDYVQRTAFPYISDVSAYHKEEKIGQGTFGEVFKARCKRTGKIVALKKILMENEKEGFPITALREVKMLQQLKHPNITELIEVCSCKTASNLKDRSTFYLVFAFCDHDLAGLLNNPKFKLNSSHIKTLFKHLLNGLNKLHRTKILHRDMKTANILVSKEGVLKLADFGLARPYFAGLNSGQSKLYTNRVVTLWYRPPELLLGARLYGPPIDMWGAGCIMAEMWTKTPIMQGDTEQRQLDLISSLCGSITPEVWPDVVNQPLFSKMRLSQNHQRLLTKKMFQMTQDSDALALLDQLLCLDPGRRKSAEEALQSNYFFTHPHPKENIKDLIDTIQGSNFEFTAGRGAHAHRRPQQQNPPRQAPAQNQAIPPGHYSDMVF